MLHRNPPVLPLLAAILTLAVACACGDSGGTTSSTGGGADTSTSTGGAGTGGAGTGGVGTGGAGTGGGPSCQLQLPSEYDGATFDANAATPLALRAQLGALNGLMKSAEGDLTITPTAAELLALYEAGNPSLRSVASATFDATVLSTFTLFESAAGNTWTPAEPPPAVGGQYGADMFSPHGADLRQAVDKGHFMGVFFNYSQDLTAGGIDQAKLDAVLAAYGAHPTFPGDSETTDVALNPYPDRLCAQYAERRSPKNASDSSLPLEPTKPGPYFLIKADFIRAQAAIAAGPSCDFERDLAVARIHSACERVTAATLVYYLNDASLKLTLANPTTADLSSALHGYGELIGFLRGMHNLPPSALEIKDSEIEALLALLGAPVGQDPTSYQLVLDPSTEVQGLLDGIGELAVIYGFTQAQVDSFKVNH